MPRSSIAGLGAVAIAAVGAAWAVRRASLAVAAASALPQRQRVTLRCVATTQCAIDAVQHQFTLVDELKRLAADIELVYEVEVPECDKIEAALAVGDCEVKYFVDGDHVCTVPNPDRRMHGVVPKFLERLLNYKAFAVAPTSANETPIHTGRRPPSAAPSAVSVCGDADSSPPGSVALAAAGPCAGAIAADRRRLVVEERMLSVMFDVFAPHAGPGNGHSASTPTDTPTPTIGTVPSFSVLDDPPTDQAAVRSRNSSVVSTGPPLQMCDLPDDIHAYDVSACQAARDNNCGPMVSALTYLLDVYDAKGDDVVAPDTVAQRLAVAIRSHLSTGDDLFTILQSLEVVCSKEDHVNDVVSLRCTLMAHGPELASIAVRYPGRVRDLLPQLDDAPLLLAFVGCSIGALDLLRVLFDRGVREFGPLTMQNFQTMMATLWQTNGTPRKTTRWARLFRSMNSTRSQTISFDEFSGFFSRKLSAYIEHAENVDELPRASTGSFAHPHASADESLVKCLAKFRLTHLLFMERRAEWSRRDFWFDAICADDDEPF